ncbi:MAG: hypothetical protein LBR45_04985 [Bacteroidales bacterium]|jgi:cell division protein FtsB|nr:hypothetical protein [Bacteroidales bacterium]
MSKSESYYKKTNRILLILLLLLLAAFIYVSINNRVVVKEKEENYAQNIALQSDFDNLMSEYEAIKLENESLTDQLSDRDSVILANAAEIKKLINSQADYRKIARKLELLRNITRDYVSRIDSLLIVNQQLSEENEQIKQEVVTEKKRSAQLTQDKKDLQDKVSVGSAILAYNVSASTYRLKGNGDEVATDKSTRIQRIKITFTLSENKLANTGDKEIYARIMRPDGVVMTPGSSELYNFELNGKQEAFTITKTVPYSGKATNVVMFWDRKNISQPAMTGVYKVALYLDGIEIGNGSFEVKK